MQVIFEHWKYIIKNLWFVLPFAVVPAFFLSLSMDFSAIEIFLRGLFCGAPVHRFSEIYNAWSLFRMDSALGVIYSICTIVCLIVFMTALLAFAEKHMRIGKRTLSGVFSGFGNKSLVVFEVLFVYFVLYEIWALLLSAMLYSLSSIPSGVAVCLLSIVLILLFFALLIYLASALYLVLPCMQITGFRMYDAFLCSYRLVIGVRRQLMLSFLVSLVPTVCVFWGISFLSAPVAVIIAFVFLVFLLLSFSIRMVTLYFRVDKLDREDLLRSYKEL